VTNFFALMLLFGALLIAAFAASSTPSNGLLLVANKGEQTLGLIDPNAGLQIATVSEGGVTGHEVAASPDGKLAFVPIYGNSGVGMPGTDGSTLAVIDLNERKVVHTIDFGHGVRPHCAVFGPKDGLLYVTTELDKSVTIIDPHTLKIVGSVPTGQAESHMLEISSDGRKGYTANVGPGTVSVLDLAGRKTVTLIPVAQHVQRISITPDSRWVFTSDTEKPRLAVIDTATNKVDRWIELPSTGYGTASTPDGKWLLVALPEANGVAVINLATLQVVKTISVPSTPQEVVIRPDGQVAYVSCDQSHQVAAIQIGEWGVKLIEAGRGADGLAWAGPINCYKGYVIEVRLSELKDGGFSAEFSVEEHDGSGVTETQFYVPDTFPSQESAIEAANQAGRQKIDVEFEGDVR
jgi:YVTN family beta-propeller protein